MSATTKGFRTRAQLRMRPPKTVSRNISPAKGGVAVHYEGTKVGITATTDHSKCEEVWRSNQRYHMDTQGWADIAYTGGFCQHGYALAGRGFGIRTAANGSTSGNDSYYAIVWLGGAGEVPTNAATNAMAWWIKEARDHGQAAGMVMPHKAFTTTSCPGVVLTSMAKILSGKTITAGNTTAVKAAAPGSATVETVKSLQAVVETARDGKWGDQTDRSLIALRGAARGGEFPVQLVQHIIGVSQDGIWGVRSRSALPPKTRALQRALRCSPDGIWGNKTEAAFRAARTKFHNKF